MLYALLYVRGVTGMRHPHRKHGESGPCGTTNQFIPGRDDRKLAPVGWATLPPAECLLHVHTCKTDALDPFQVARGKF